MRTILVKYGGNAMRDPALQQEVIRALIQVKQQGDRVVIVHGGGPFIEEQLNLAGIPSEFVGGHRKTTPEALVHIEMVLKGKVNGRLVSLFNEAGSKAIGISGKDARVVTAIPRKHTTADGAETDLGRVGDVEAVNSDFLEDMLRQCITPVIACIGADAEGRDYNINGDMMAGHVAGALRADIYVVLTDIDGLRSDVNDPATHIDRISVAEARKLFGTSIKGGMIPKMESCITALEQGAGEAVIINGTRPEQLLDRLLKQQHVGTTITA